MAVLLDTHYHFDFLADQELRAAFLDELSQATVRTTEGAELGINVVAQTIKPSEYVQLIEQAAGLEAPGRRLPLWSLGFHPWQITSAEQADAELSLFRSHLGSTRFIGEIGLDFAPRRLQQASEELQMRVFREILEMVCDAAENATGGSGSPYVLSIHAVRASTSVLDVLEELGVAERNVAPIIHWFSGTSDELTRLIKLGGLISVNHHMLESKRGRAYAKQIPADRFLIETDLPEGTVTAVSQPATSQGIESQPAASHEIESQPASSHEFESQPDASHGNGADSQDTKITKITQNTKNTKNSANTIAQFAVRELQGKMSSTLAELSDIRSKDVWPDIDQLQHRLFTP